MEKLVVYQVPACKQIDRVKEEKDHSSVFTLPNHIYRPSPLADGPVRVRYPFIIYRLSIRIRIHTKLIINHCLTTLPLITLQIFFTTNFPILASEEMDVSEVGRDGFIRLDNVLL